MMNHTDCDHPATPAARAKCRRANGQHPTPRTPSATRTPKRKGPDPDSRPADKGACCNNCQLRIRWVKGIDLISKREVEVCEKCSYLLDDRETITHLHPDA
jgi:ribosomal protein S12 methylthiotransferase accessory factor YcaO